jgi:hypothetical protein
MCAFDSRSPGSFATVACGIASAKLDASVGASGPHDFAVRFKLRSSTRRQSVHRIPHPTFVTIAKRPSCEGRTRELVEVICPTGQAKYFFEEDWTTQITLNRLTKIQFTRMRFREANLEQAIRSAPSITDQGRIYRTDERLHSQLYKTVSSGCPLPRWRSVGPLAIQDWLPAAGMGPTRAMTAPPQPNKKIAVDTSIRFRGWGRKRIQGPS